MLNWLIAKRPRALALVALLAIVSVTAAHAQSPPYGPEITVEQAKTALGAARAEATKNSWNVAIAIVDTHGFLVAFERVDDTHTGSIQVAIDKAVSAALWRRSTKAFQDAVAGGGAGMRVLNLRGASALDGGVPIIVGGKVVGGIGVSGVTADQDGLTAKAGADSLK